MSGHSKWSNIKNKKAANDAARGSVFTRLAKAISIAVKKGGGIGNPDMNFALRLAVDQARGYNMPKENIERAIDKGMGKGGAELVELTIEAFGPDGVMVIIELVTDSRNRSVAEIRTLIEKYGGSMGEPGSVAYLFEHVGIIHLDTKISDELELSLIDLGLIDIDRQEEESTLYSTPQTMHEIIKYLQASGATAGGSIGYRPTSLVEVSDESKILHFLEMIEQYEDVQEVYANLG